METSLAQSLVQRFFRLFHPVNTLNLTMYSHMLLFNQQTGRKTGLEATASPIVNAAQTSEVF
jgi:hypothetical protein